MSAKRTPCIDTVLSAVPHGGMGASAENRSQITRTLLSYYHDEVQVKFRKHIHSLLF